MRKSPPRLQGYEGAIAANNSMAQAFGNVNKIANDWKGQEERKRSNKVLEAYRQSTLDETKNQNKFNNDFKIKDFEYGKTRDTVKDNQWQQGFDETKNQNNWSRVFNENKFDYQKGQDKINNDFKQQSLNNQTSNANKPSYATFNGVDADGNPILKMIDKKTGNVIDTGQTVYQAPKQSTPEQAQYYNDRSIDMAIKTNNKAMEQLSTIDGWDDLDTQSQKQALDYYLKNGIMPKIKGTGWFDGKVMLDIPLTEEQKAAKKTTKKDGSNIDLYKD